MRAPTVTLPALLGTPADGQMRQWPQVGQGSAHERVVDPDLEQVSGAVVIAADHVGAPAGVLRWAAVRPVSWVPRALPHQRLPGRALLLWHADRAGSRTAQPVQTLKKIKKNKKNGIFKISRKSNIRPPRAVRAARGAFNVWLRTVHAAATLRPPIGVLADPAAT
jgi:hypothetical protein